jgi:hypothetical protein
VLIERPITWKKVFEIPLWFTMKLANVGLADTCKLYDVAPPEAFHPKIVLVGMLEAPFEGKESVGGEGAAGTVESTLRYTKLPHGPAKA